MPRATWLKPRDKQKRALDNRVDKHYDGFAGPPGQNGNLEDSLEVHRQRDEHQSVENPATPASATVN
jgi:hypothetical protein